MLFPQDLLHKPDRYVLSVESLDIKLNVAQSEEGTHCSFKAFDYFRKEMHAWIKNGKHKMLVKKRRRFKHLCIPKSIMGILTH